MYGDESHFSVIDKYLGKENKFEIKIGRMVSKKQYEYFLERGDWVSHDQIDTDVRDHVEMLIKKRLRLDKIKLVR